MPPTEPRLGLYRHGDRISAEQAVRHAAMRGADEFDFIPDPLGTTLTLKRRDLATPTERRAADAWRNAQRGAIRAEYSRWMS